LEEPAPSAPTGSQEPVAVTGCARRRTAPAPSPQPIALLRQAPGGGSLSAPAAWRLVVAALPLPGDFSSIGPNGRRQ